MSRRRVLVLQMCRMGDTLQTTPMLRGLRREHPDAEITLVLLDGFASTPVPDSLFDRRVLFPQVEIAGALASPGGDWRAQIERLRAFVRELGDEPFDLAVNLTQTDLSSLLMAVIPARDRRGPVIKPNRQRSVRDPWMQYFWADARSRVFGCFNLVDLFTWTAGVACDGRGLEMAVSADAERAIDERLSERALQGRPLIAMQLGASDEAKRWPTERLAATADLLPASSGEIVIVGTSAERDLAERFLARCRRTVHDFVGATSLQELGALLRRCRLLVTNDTGTMHVATAVGTRVVDISTGPVFVHETGPYGLGHLVVEPEMDCFPCTAGSQCHHHACRQRLDPVDAAAIVRFALGEGVEPIPSGSRLLGGRRTRTGRIAYWPLQPSRVTPSDLVRESSARMWEESLGAPPAAGCVPADDMDGRAQGTAFAGPGDDLSAGWRAEVTAALDEVARESDAAAAAVRRLPAAGARQRAALAGEAHRHLQRLLVLGETQRACHPITGFLLVEIESAVETDLASLASGQASAYTATARRARRLAGLLRAARLSDPGIPLAPAPAAGA